MAAASPAFWMVVVFDELQEDDWATERRGQQQQHANCVGLRSQLRCVGLPMTEPAAARAGRVYLNIVTVVEL